MLARLRAKMTRLQHVLDGGVMGDKRDERLVQWQSGGGVHRQSGAPVIDQPSYKSGSEGSRGDAEKEVR